jgi:beta-N-acetylhexosaminidase
MSLVPHGNIAAIGVLPEYQHKGLGTAFLIKAKIELKNAAHVSGYEKLKSLEIGSLTPRFWPQVPIDFPQDAKDFLVHRGIHANQVMIE